MNVLITGANGFVGRALAARLLRDGRIDPHEPAIRRLVLADVRFDAPGHDARARQVAGSIADVGVQADLCAEPPDLVFHLASVPGGQAERDHALGLEINLHATLGMLERMRRQSRPPRFIFASSVAVYGSPLPERVSDSTPLRPSLSYGAQKLIGEILLQDYSRRGWIDGRGLRLPGIVARPPIASGLLSAFMSDLFWRLAEGKPFSCPVSPTARAWWMSVGCCVDNLIHAARLAADRIPGAGRVWTLPVLHLTIAQVVEGLTRLYGEDRRKLISFRPDAALEAQFGCYPELDDGVARALGFGHDGDVDTLVRRALSA